MLERLALIALGQVAGFSLDEIARATLLRHHALIPPHLLR
ncbi:MerR family DNA-binding protein [Sorangium sp. So ce1389]